MPLQPRLTHQSLISWTVGKKGFSCLHLISHVWSSPPLGSLLRFCCHIYNKSTILQTLTFCLIRCTNCYQDLWCHMMPLGHNGLNTCFNIVLSRTSPFIMLNWFEKNLIELKLHCQCTFSIDNDTIQVVHMKLQSIRGMIIKIIFFLIKSNLNWAFWLKYFTIPTWTYIWGS